MAHRSTSFDSVYENYGQQSQRRVAPQVSAIHHLWQPVAVEQLSQPAAFIRRQLLAQIGGESLQIRVHRTYSCTTTFGNVRFPLGFCR